MAPKEDPKKWTLKKVSIALGVHLDTVSGWLRSNSDIRKASKDGGPIPDARVKVNPKKWTQSRVAVALGVDQQAVAKWFRSNTTGSKAPTTISRPDARVKVNPKHPARAREVRRKLAPDNLSGAKGPPRTRARATTQDPVKFAQSSGDHPPRAREQSPSTTGGPSLPVPPGTPKKYLKCPHRDLTSRQIVYNEISM